MFSHYLSLASFRFGISFPSNKVVFACITRLRYTGNISESMFSPVTFSMCLHHTIGQSRKLCLMSGVTFPTLRSVHWVAYCIMSVSSPGLKYLNFREVLSMFLACDILRAIIMLAAACCDGKNLRNFASLIINIQSLYASPTTYT